MHLRLSSLTGRDYDDILYPGALAAAADFFARRPERPGHFAGNLLRSGKYH
ncbi:MAG: hypothetical protein ACLQU1_39130 [Bryobacteraceae bacterium]